MSITCDIILQWRATPDQLSTLGTALWRWCTHPAHSRSIYQYLDNQALADLIAGRLSASSEADDRGVHFRIRDETSLDRRATISRLRRELPAKGVEDILVDGKSWKLSD